MKIPYYNLRDEAHRLPIAVGRESEMQRLDRLIGRRIAGNACVVGESGRGKTSLVWSWMRRISRRAEYDRYALLQFDAAHLSVLSDDALMDTFTEALATVPASIIFIDDIGNEIYRNNALVHRVSRLYDTLLRSREIHLIFALQFEQYAWLSQEFSSFVQMCETIPLKEQSAIEYTMILRQVLPRLRGHRLIVQNAALQDIVAFAARFPSMGQMPRSAIRLLDEALIFATSKGEKVLTQDAIAHVVEGKTGVPRSRLTQNDLASVKRLRETLSERIVDQESAITSIATTLQRAKLGLRDQGRPLGSFLMLGPSGVGKTETAKCVAELLFGMQGSFIRFDMSEFQQDHTVQRLIGAPAGYVGYDEGGALTSALKKNPHSLILLDEIEKAHPKVFDIFLQVLDDGRLTSGQNETVDARHAIIMATSNAAVQEILSAFDAGVSDEEFIKETVMPVLSKTFRLEFINRFDKILIFRPLSVPSLMKIAQLEMAKIEKRLGKYRVQFDIEPSVLEERVQKLADPRFGARPVKRFVEETCETLLMRSLLGSNV